VRVAESIGAAAGIARSRGSCVIAGTFPRFVWLQGLPSGPAVINWTSRAEVNAEFAQLRVHADHKPMPISLALVVSLLQAALRKRRAARNPANASLRLRWTVVGPVHRVLRQPASSP
jgi:hypothetical protein